MKQAQTDDVRRLYETYPYPFSHGNTEADPLIANLLRGYFPMHPLTGWRILDAGCGTGHKLAGMARTFPGAHFVGLELSGPSSQVARSLAESLGLANMEVRNGNILELGDSEKFDYVQAFGVVHHLADPQRGLDKLAGALTDEGILAIWLYNPLGEAERLIQRELLMTLWRENWLDMAEGQKWMELLQLELSPTHYGPHYGPVGREANGLEANADAFMHPIVNAYRFEESLDMLRKSGLTWVAIDMINLPGNIKLLNLSNFPDPFTKRFCLSASDLFTSEALQERYASFSIPEKLRVIELVMKPRGFQILAGRGQAHVKLTPRVQGNVTSL